MSDYNTNQQTPNTAAQNPAGYQPPQYTQQYGQYQPPRYTQQYGQQPYQAPVYNAPPPPVYQTPQGFGQKSRIAAALLAFMFGYLGVHNFYMGNTGKGVAQLLIGTLGSALCGVGTIAAMIWSIYEGIQLLKGTVTVDGHGIPFID
ncbi:MAG: NINE protein [Clostridia bacterium]|nr:NINE protein [Clostridia bacterium]